MNTDVRLQDRRRALELVAITVFLAAIVPFVAFAVPQLSGADHSYVVRSSSMSPTMPAGSAVFVDGVSPDAVETGDVITYRQRASVAAREDDGTNLVTHRVVEVVEREDGRYFRTKGDANEDPDPRLVPAEALVGEVDFSIPVLGQLIVYAGSPYGLVALVIVPMVILVTTELRDLVGAYRASRTGAGDSTSDTDAETGVGND